MAEDLKQFLICDVRFNDKLIVDVNLPKTCSIGKIIQGLWEDEKFRSVGLNYLKSKKDKKEDVKVKQAVKECSLKSFRSLDRSILRAYVAIRIMPTWRWLEFKDFVADFENKKDSCTIGDVLGTLPSGAHKPVLRIVPKSDSEADDQEVKSIVQELLTTKSLATLAAGGCPLSKGMLSLIGQDKYACTISHDKREKFIHWLRRQDLANDTLTTTPERRVETPTQPQNPLKIAKSRVTFDPEAELSNLVSWFDSNQRPGKELIEEYTEVLNKGRCGKSRRMLTPESIAVWFKNRRAKVKKEESCFPEPWEKMEEEVTISSSEQGDNENTIPISMATVKTDRKCQDITGGSADEATDHNSVTMSNVENDSDSVGTSIVADQGNNVVSVTVATVENDSIATVTGVEADQGSNVILVTVTTEANDHEVPQMAVEGQKSNLLQSGVVLATDTNSQLQIKGNAGVTEDPRTNTESILACLIAELTENHNQYTNQKVGDQEMHANQGTGDQRLENVEQRAGDQEVEDHGNETVTDETGTQFVRKDVSKRSREVDQVGELDSDDLNYSSQCDPNCKRQCVEDKGEDTEGNREIKDKGEDRGQGGM